MERKLTKWPFINDAGNWEGSKIGQNCRRIVLKNCRHGGGGCQKSGKQCRRRLWMVPKSTYGPILLVCH